MNANPYQLIYDYTRTFAATHAGCNPPVIEYKFNRYYVTFKNGDRETWTERKLRQCVAAWNRRMG